MLLQTALNTALQLGAVLLLSVLVWLIVARRRTRFVEWIGLVAAPRRALLYGLALGVLTAATVLMVPAARELAGSANSVPGQALAHGATPAAIVSLLILALIKTALAEEILFRGLLGKRLIARFGFMVGNSVQAALFGAIHLVVLLSPAASMGLGIFTVAVTTALGFANGWLNERFGSGSILPGWAAHGSANLLTYLAVAAMLDMT
jgi:uncharacterized protein